MDRDEIVAAALHHGFERAGIACTNASFDGHPAYVDWIEHGRHAGMHYLFEQAQWRRTVESVLPGARSALVVAKHYAQPYPIPEGRPKIARYALNRDYHNVLRKRLKALVRELQLHFEGDLFRICVDSAPLLERELAQRAGLGWFGKNTMLIDSKFGSYFLLAVVLTTAEWQPSAPSGGGCGSCRTCVEACPTGAIVFDQERWQVDSRQCISYWTIEHKGAWPEGLGSNFQGWAFGCDICQEVCPFNQSRPTQPLRSAPTVDPAFSARERYPTSDEWLAMTEDEWDRISLGTPLRRAGLEGMKRNVRGTLRRDC